jgi:hypothetical protein
MSFTLIITAAGLDALVDAQNGTTEPIQVAEIGFSQSAVAAAPTLTALPGEFKRIDTISGTAVSENIIHLTAQDSTGDIYDLRSFALYLTDGTLFAAYGQEEPIVSKASVLNLQLAFDVAFQDGITGDIEFGDATFLYPPASETVRGVAEIATQAEVDAGADDQRLVTPLKLAGRLAPIITAIAIETTERQAAISAETAARQAAITTEANTRAQAISDEAATRAGAVAAEANTRAAADQNLANSIAALVARTITGGGLATGGGSLADSRVISVAAASVAQLLAGNEPGAAITPAVFGPIVKSFGQNGYVILALGDRANALCIQWGRFVASANSITNVNFPIAFAQCFVVVADGTSDGNTDAQDNYPSVRGDSIEATGFAVWSANQQSDSMGFIAIGRVNLT